MFPFLFNSEYSWFTCGFFSDPFVFRGVLFGLGVLEYPPLSSHRRCPGESHCGEWSSLPGCSPESTQWQACPALAAAPCALKQACSAAGRDVLRVVGQVRGAVQVFWVSASLMKTRPVSSKSRVWECPTLTVELLPFPQHLQVSTPGVDGSASVFRWPCLCPWCAQAVSLCVGLE